MSWLDWVAPYVETISPALNVAPVVGPPFATANAVARARSQEAEQKHTAQQEYDLRVRERLNNIAKDQADGSYDGKVGDRAYEGASPEALAAGAAAQSSTGGPYREVSDQPGASAADGPAYLGYESYPGFDPETHGDGRSLYTSDMPFTEWRDMSPKEVRDAKEALWQAGYYGRALPSMTEVVGAADRKALAAAMGDANTTPGARDWQSVAAIKAGAAADSGQDARTAALRKRRADQATAITALRSFADQNGIRLPEDFVARKANQIAAGVKGSDEVFNDLREKFVARAFPAFADDIRAGENMRDIASPYLSSYAQLLEVPDGEVDLHDPLIKSALQNVNDKGEAAPVPLWKFEQQVKRDPRWASTNNAWDEVSSQALEVMKMFGIQA